MQNASRATSFSALALGIVAALAVSQADASGFQIRENSVKNLGRANAGTAVAWGDASVVLNNPAAMVNLDKTTLQADVTVIDLTADFSGSGTTAVGTPLSGGNGGDPGDATAVPALAVVIPLDRFSIGASVSAPFGLKTDYDPTWVGRYNAIRSEVKTVDFTVSFAYALTDRFSLGAGVIYQNTDVTLSNAIDFGTALCAGSGNVLNCFNPAFPFQPQGADGNVVVKGDDTSFGWVAGLQWRPSDQFAIGYSHRSEIDHDIDGNANFDAPASVTATLAALGDTRFNDVGVTAPLTTPAVDTVSAQWNVNDDFRLLADIQRTQWSSLKSVVISRSDGSLLASEAFDWDDSTSFAFGGEWDFNDAFTFRAGLGFDETPTKDATRTPRLPDNDRTIYTFGATWNVSPALSIDAAYMRLQIDDPKIDAVSSSGSRLTGTFNANADLFGISAQYRF